MKVYKVNQINKYMKKIISEDFILSDISVEGEISNFTHHYSGHMYFSLKDESSKLKSVMFKWDNKDINIKLENGMKVIAHGNISVYDKEGIYQLYVKEIEESGLGDLYKRFEALKKKLLEEGLFDSANKKILPKLPKTIGVVTSATGAAIKDIITVIKRRFPPVNIILYPTLVQGDSAPKNIIEGLNYLDSRDDIDLIILGRGGGAEEELFAFNDENLARVIYDLNTPCISAVGHEIDFTISDFVADLRAPTPSAAAEIAVPDINVYKSNLHDLYGEIISKLFDKLHYNRNNLNNLYKDIKYLSPSRQLEDRIQSIDILYKSYYSSFSNMLIERKRTLEKLKSKLDLLNPTLPLDKGYGIITNLDGKILRSIEGLKLGEEIKINFKDGRVLSIIDDIEKGDI